MTLESDRKLLDLHALLLDRKAKMPEGSASTALLRQGSPEIIAKCTEELGEAFQALLEQDPDQVNLEISQAVYNLIVLMVHTGKGSMDALVNELEKERANPALLPQTLGLSFRICAESMGKAYGTLLDPTSNDGQVNSSVAAVIYSFEKAMKVAKKGSIEGVWAQI